MASVVVVRVAAVGIAIKSIISEPKATPMADASIMIVTGKMIGSAAAETPEPP
jgi:hypothetical protein